MLQTIFTWTIYGALIVHAGLLSYTAWRVWRGENSVDRLLAAELSGTLLLAILVLIALVERTTAYLDVALGLAALSFISVIALGKYANERRMV